MINRFLPGTGCVWQDRGGYSAAMTGYSRSARA